MVTFKNPDPSAGCFAAAKATANVLIVWEGDWLMAGTPSFWDPIHAADPAMFDAITPWAHIASRPELRVIILESENNGLGRDGGRARAGRVADGPRSQRRLHRGLPGDGRIDDDNLALHEWQTVWRTGSRRQEPRQLRRVPGSTHDYLSPAGWLVFLDAFRRAAALAD
jgi:hypothetical protein